MMRQKPDDEGLTDNAWKDFNTICDNLKLGEAIGDWEIYYDFYMAGYHQGAEEWNDYV